MRIFACLLLLSVLTLPARAQQATCEVALVMAMDVSRSVDAREFDLIRHGTAEAFRHPDIAQLVARMDGGVMVTVTQWSGAGQQRQMVPWRHLQNSGDLLALADEIDAMKRAYRFELTAPGNALDHAFALLRAMPGDCRRKVIDLAGDGVRNTGLPTGETGDRIAALGVTINGLVVRGDTPDPLEFYRAEVKRGALSFVEISKGYKDFPRAIFLKLLRELSPSLSALPIAGGRG